MGEALPPPSLEFFILYRQSVANLMFRNVSFNFATAISKFDTFSSFHIVRTQITKVTNFLSFCTIGISIYQKCILPYFIIPSTFSPQASSPLERSRQTDGRTTFFTPCYLSSFFPPLSARGPTRRRNSTGLAELWGGSPIELEKLLVHPKNENSDDNSDQIPSIQNRATLKHQNAAVIFVSAVQITPQHIIII